MLIMLEERLACIDFAVNGNAHASAEPPASTSAKARLRTLTNTLDALVARSRSVSDIVQLQKDHPRAFDASASSPTPASLSSAALAQLVLAHEQTYKLLASQLSTLNENKELPDASALTKLVALQPRIATLQAKQRQQAQEFASLRAQSARLLETWYEKGVLDMGEYWAQCEERLRDCEILVRRKEAAKRREDAVV